MEYEKILARGSISVEDGDRFRHHVDVLRLFGKNLGVHMRAMYKLNEEYCVWFPKLYRNRDFVNILSSDRTILEMNQLPESTISSGKHFPLDEPGVRFVFAHIVDHATGEKYYSFVGVFSELEGNMSHAACSRIADMFYFDSKGSFSLSPLN